jgi:hypothetical protein
MSNENKNEKVEDWRNEHGQPNFRFLESLADEGGPLSSEKLRFIADDLDVAYDDSTSNKDLVEKIMLATQSDPNMTD